MMVNNIIFVALGISDAAVIAGEGYTKGYCRASGQIKSILLTFQGNIGLLYLYFFKKRLEDAMYKKVKFELVTFAISLVLAFVFSIGSPRIECPDTKRKEGNSTYFVIV